jgi:hypothetical protein
MEYYNSLHLFRVPEEKESLEKLKKLVADADAFDKPGRESYLLCHQCLQFITSISEMSEVAGAHQHTFVNPEGILFEIGCFRKAAGCLDVGQATHEFTWFKGFSWKIAVCRCCLTHLGWMYVSEREHFYGLILDRLKRAPDSNGLRP